MRGYPEEASEVDVAPYRTINGVGFATEVGGDDRQRPALERHERILKALAQQSSTIDRVVLRLEDVLLPDRPSPMADSRGAEEPTKEPEQSTLASQQEKVLSILRTQTSTLDSLLRRIDL